MGKNILVYWQGKGKLMLTKKAETGLPPKMPLKIILRTGREKELYKCRSMNNSKNVENIISILKIIIQFFTATQWNFLFAQNL